MEQQQVFYNGKLYKKLDVTKMRILCAIGFLGLLGIPIAGLHRFYKKEIGMGILYLFTGGLVGIGTLVDLITMEKKVLEHNYMVDEMIKLKELEEARRQGQINVYKQMGESENVKMHVRGDMKL